MAGGPFLGPSYFDAEWKTEQNRTASKFSAAYRSLIIIGRWL